MPGPCGRCGRYVGAAEERLALGTSWHFECFTCAICNKGLDSLILAEYRELNEVYCKSCYRKFVGIQGYGYGPNGPTLIIYDVPEEFQDHEGTTGSITDQTPRQWVQPPTRLGKVFLRTRPIPPHYGHVGTGKKASSTLIRSREHISQIGQAHEGMLDQSREYRQSQGTVKITEEFESVSSAKSMRNSSKPGSNPVIVAKSNSSGNPSTPVAKPNWSFKTPPPPSPKFNSSNRVNNRPSMSIPSPGGSNTRPPLPPPPPPLPFSRPSSIPPPPPPPPSKNNSVSNRNSRPSTPNPSSSGTSKIPPPPPPPSKNNTMSKRPTPVSSSGNSQTRTLPPPPPPMPRTSLPSSRMSNNSQPDTARLSRSLSKQNSRSLSASASGSNGSTGRVLSNQNADTMNRTSFNTEVSGSGPTEVTDPNCPPLFFCGGKCVGTPSYPRYPPGSADGKRMHLGPNYGAVRTVPKGVGELCRRCGRPVYHTELQLGYHGAYHTECFKCCSCGKKLDSTSVAEHQGEIFCKGCYRRNFAVHGVGFGVGAGALQTP